MSIEGKMIEFEKLETGGKFYLSNPEMLPDTAAYTKIVAQKNSEGKWSNAKNGFGLQMFVQYDKRVWIK
jgi:hypothetical protein